MSYSLDLRQRVINFVQNGGSKAEASRRYEVSRDTIYRWLAGKNRPSNKKLSRKRKIDVECLIKRVKEFPEDRLIDHASAFNVHFNAIFYQFKKLGITRKKNLTLQGKKVSAAYILPPDIT